MQKIFKFTLLLTFVLGLPYSANAYTDEMITSRYTLEQSLIKHKGQVIYLDFWASWCVPCVRSFPWMNKIQVQYKEQGFTVISVNLDADQALAAQFLTKNPASAGFSFL